MPQGIKLLGEKDLTPQLDRLGVELIQVVRPVSMSQFCQRSIRSALPRVGELLAVVLRVECKGDDRAWLVLTYDDACIGEHMICRREWIRQREKFVDGQRPCRF